MKDNKQRNKYPFWAKKLLKLFENTEYGSLVVDTPTGEKIYYNGKNAGRNAHLKIYDWRVCKKLIFKGDIGFGEAYRDKWWDSNDLSALVEFAIENEKSIKKLYDGNLLALLLSRIKNWFLKLNSKTLSKRNIHEHYDLGNDFFKEWLDDTMTYSSAYFDGDYNKDLSVAQTEKYKNIYEQANITEGDSVLEIGCGWGGFAEYAASRGANVTSITISKEQYDFAKVRLEKIGLSKKVNLKLMDYREITGKYDAIVSIEMIEAVGSYQWAKYFNIIKKSLKKGGHAVIQGITVTDDQFEDYQKGTDFIQEYIFPGGMLIADKLINKMADKVNLKNCGINHFGKDYAETLKRWRNTYNEKSAYLSTIGYDEKFNKIWNFYLATCEGAFNAGKINVIHARLKNEG